MIRIGIVLPSVPIYSETFFRSKISALLRNGFEVILFVKNPNGANNFICPVKVHPKVSANAFIRPLQTVLLFAKLLLRAPKPSFRMLQITRKQNYTLFQAIRAAVIGSAILPERLDWLHFGFAATAIEREYVGKAIGARVAVSFRGFDINQTPLMDGNLYKKFWPNVDKAHSISKYLLIKARELGLSEKTPFSIITPAIDIQRFSPKPHQREPNSILLVSRLHWIKGIEQVLEAAAMLKAEGIALHLAIAGEGEELERLLFARYQLGLMEEVSFLGRKSSDEIIELMQCHDVFIQYSHQEGFCNAALEAQASGMLCVVSDADGLIENVLHAQTGWVVPKRNPKALAKKLQEVFILSDTEKDTIRNQARNRIVKCFDLKNQEKEFVHFYTDIINT